jgi:hypothetical protein
LATGGKSRIRLIHGTHVVVHQCAANPAGGAQKQAMCRTLGGHNTKIMALADGRGLPVKLLLIEGQAYEGEYVIPMLGAPHGLLVVGDKGFDCYPLPQQLEQLGASHCIPSNRTDARSAGSTRSYMVSARRWRTTSAA